MNPSDFSKLDYKAKIEWYKERMYAVSEGTVILDDYLKEKEDTFETDPHTPEELIEILDDLKKKASKLNDKIEFLSANLTIPVDKEKNPDLSNEIASRDSQSRGEFISYKLYDDLLKEQEYVKNEIKLKDLVSGATGDEGMDSIMIQNLISNNYAKYSGTNPATVAASNGVQQFINVQANNLLSWNQHEYGARQILNFADNYLDINPDPAYIPWSTRRDVGEELTDVNSLGDLWSHFSDNYKERTDGFIDGVNEIRALRPDERIEGLTTRSIVYANQFLNGLNDIFDMSWATKLICCFLQFGIRLDMKTLKGLRAMLQLLASGITIDFSDILNGLKDILNNIFRGFLMNALVGLITQIIQRLVDPIKKWLNNPDSDVWNKIFACTPVSELIQKYIVEAIDYLEALLNKLIENWYKKLELKRIKQGLILQKKTSQKWIGELASLLDSIIGVSEAAAKCGIRGSPSDAPEQAVVQSYNIGNVNLAYVFPKEETPNIYNSFIPVTPGPKDDNSAGQVGTTEFDHGPIGDKASAVDSMKLSDCLANMPTEFIEGVKEWL